MAEPKIILQPKTNQVVKFSPFQSKDTLNLGVIKLASDYVKNYKSENGTSTNGSRFIKGYSLKNDLIGSYNTLKYEKDSHTQYGYRIINEIAVEQIFPIGSSIIFNPAERYLKAVFSNIKEYRNSDRDVEGDTRFQTDLAQSEGFPTQSSISTATSDLAPDFIMNFLRNISQKINSTMIQNMYYRQTHFDPDYSSHNMLTLNERNELKCHQIVDPFNSAADNTVWCVGDTDKNGNTTIANYGTIKVIQAPVDLQLYAIIRGIPIQMRKRITSTYTNLTINNAEFVYPEYLLGKNMHMLESITYIKAECDAQYEKYLTDEGYSAAGSIKIKTKFYTGILYMDDVYTRFGMPYETSELFDYAANCNILNAPYRNVFYTNPDPITEEYFDPNEVLTDPWWEENEIVKE